MTLTFQEHFTTVILPKLQKQLQVTNPMAVPRFEKVVVNVGIGSRFTNSKDFSDVLDNVTAITGQKPVVRYSKIAISNFKLRAGTPNGVVVTLRGKRMYDFLNRLINVAFPRMRDFHGVSAKAFDKKGNYSIGIRDISVFPEVSQDDLSHIHGFEITIVTTASDEGKARILLDSCHFPFKKDVSIETSTAQSDSREECAVSDVSADS